MNLFVAGLPMDMDDSELMEFFEKFGLVNSARVAIDKETGKSKGFAFVEMPNDDEAKEAMEGLNDLALGRKVLVVKPAESRSNSGGGGFNNNRGGGGGGFNRGGGGFNNNRGGGGFNRDGGGGNNRDNRDNRDNNNRDRNRY